MYDIVYDDIFTQLFWRPPLRCYSFIMLHCALLFFYSSFAPIYFLFSVLVSNYSSKSNKLWIELSLNVSMDFFPVQINATLPWIPSNNKKKSDSFHRYFVSYHFFGADNTFTIVAVVAATHDVSEVHFRRNCCLLIGTTVKHILTYCLRCGVKVELLAWRCCPKNAPKNFQKIQTK